MAEHAFHGVAFVFVMESLVAKFSLNKPINNLIIN